MPDHHLPYWPRALGAEWAAAYVGLSVTTFREGVAPSVPPFHLSERRLAWLRDDLDAWLEKQAGRKPGTAEDLAPNPWDDV